MCNRVYTFSSDIFWFKDTDDETDSLEPGEKYEMTSEEDKHTLEIFFTTVADAGQYICIAKDDVSSSHWLFELTVEGSFYFLFHKNLALVG